MRDKLVLRGQYPGNATAQDIHLENGVVKKITPAGKGGVDAGSAAALFLPTLLDIQVNGAGGVDLLNPKLTVDDLHRLNAFMAKWGVSQWVPTLVTNALEAMEQGCRVIVEARRDAELKRAIPGIHLEGPCISSEDGPRGAHPLAHVRLPKVKDFDRLWRASAGSILYTTLSPELPGAVPYIRNVVARGCVVSLGHHNATAQQIHAAVEAGARLSTHLGNGAHPKMQRHFNPLWPQLAEDRLMASLIADLHHLPEPVLKTFVRCKGAKNTILVSDSVHLAGMKPGIYALFGGNVQLHANGKITIPGTDLLAGSGLMLVQGVLNVARCTDLTLKQSLACASSNPARLLGLRTRGRLPQIGQKANFCLVSGQGNNVKILASFVDGKRVK